MRIILKCILKSLVEPGVNLSRLGQGQFAGSSEGGNIWFLKNEGNS